MWLVAARRRSTLTVSTVLVLLAAHSAHSITHRLTWNLESVQRYPSTSPFEVTRGDDLTVSCEIGSFSNLYYAVDEAQYDSCSCSVAGVKHTCRSILSCLGGEQVFTIPIRFNSGSVPDAIVFEPGQTYYLLSFSNGREFTTATSGGQCETDGFRMAIHVNESYIKPTDAPSDPPSDPTNSTMTSDPVVTEEKPTTPGGEKPTTEEKPSLRPPAPLNPSSALSLRQYQFCLSFLTVLLCFFLVGLLGNTWDL